MPLEGRIAEASVARLRRAIAAADDDLHELAREPQTARASSPGSAAARAREPPGGGQDLRAVHRHERVTAIALIIERSPLRECSPRSARERRRVWV